MKLQVLPYVTVEIDDRLRVDCAAQANGLRVQRQGVPAQRRRRFDARRGTRSAHPPCADRAVDRSIRWSRLSTTGWAPKTPQRPPLHLVRGRGQLALRRPHRLPCAKPPTKNEAGSRTRPGGHRNCPCPPALDTADWHCPRRDVIAVRMI